MRELRVKYYDREKADYFKALYCGMSKAGKTFLLGTYPSPFVIDTDGGGRTLKSLHIPYISYSIADLKESDVKKRPQPYEEIRYLLGKLIINKGRIWIESDPPGEEAPKLNLDGPREGYFSYDVQTLGFDSITMLSQIMLFECGLDAGIGETKNVSGKRDFSSDGMSFAEYRALMWRLEEIFDRTKDLKMNIVVTAGIDGKLDEKGNWIFSKYPDVDGKFRAICQHYFDTVALLETDLTKPDTHYLRTHSNIFNVGTRDRLPPSITNPTYELIIAEMKKLEKGTIKQ